EEPRRGQERAGRVESCRIVHEEQLCLTRPPRRVVDECTDQGPERAWLGHGVVVEEEDELSRRQLDTLVAGADEAEIHVVPYDAHAAIPVGGVRERSSRCV